MIGAELEAQRSSPAEWARGIFLALDGDRGVKAIAAMRNVCELGLMHANKILGREWR